MIFKNYIKESIKNHNQVLSNLNEETFMLIEKSVKICLNAISKNKKIFWCGNGGSASQANHLSAELVGGMQKDKKSPYNSICLNSDQVFMTAWSNDVSFDEIFSRQLQALSSNGDVLFVLTTSGNSKNIVNVSKFAKLNNIKTISLTGNEGGSVKKYSDVNINIHSNDTQRIQEMHILIGHIICDLIEKSS